MNNNDKRFTLRDSILNFGTLNNNVMVVDSFFLLDKVVGVAIFSSGGVVMSGISTRRQLNLRDIVPLHQREDYSYYGTDRDENLSAEIWKNGDDAHGETHTDTNPTKRRRRTKKQGFWWGGRTVGE